MIFLAPKPADLEEVAAFILHHSEGFKIFAFYGEMGVGKTALITAILRSMGVRDEISSPTFSLVNEYRDSEGSPSYHFDFYRIENEEEAYDIGYEDYFYSGNLCFIEWPEKIPSLLPEETVKVEIIREGELRKIQLNLPS